MVSLTLKASLLRCLKNILPKKFPCCREKLSGIVETRQQPSSVMLMWALTCVKSSHKLDASKAEGLILPGLGRGGGGAKHWHQKGENPKNKDGSHHIKVRLKLARPRPSRSPFPLRQCLPEQKCSVIPTAARTDGCHVTAASYESGPWPSAPGDWHRDRATR